MAAATLYERIYAVVRQIPCGRVVTYGQVALLAGIPGHARQVGYALHSLPAGSPVPWQRVVNRAGRISPRTDPTAEAWQRLRLEDEGVRFTAAGVIDMEKYGWPGAPV